MAKKLIPDHEIKFFSSASPAHWARMFTWNSNLYRAIYSSSVDFFEDHRDVFDKLISEGLLIDTNISDFNLKGYGLILEHRRIPFVTYPFEWPAEALRDAALLIIDLNLKLIKNGLAIIDAHAWNILFDGAKPIFVDFGSIAPLSEVNAKNIINQLNGNFTYPLYLMANGHRRIARLLLTDHTHVMTRKEFIIIYVKI